MTKKYIESLIKRLNFFYRICILFTLRLIKFLTDKKVSFYCSPLHLTLNCNSWIVYVAAVINIIRISLYPLNRDFERDFRWQHALFCELLPTVSASKREGNNQL